MLSIDATANRIEDPQSASDTAPPHETPLRSLHTNTFPEILRQLGCSLAVSTYQAGQVILLRADDGVLNTHFRSFPRPMGMAAYGGRLAMGVGREIVELHNMPAVAAKVEPSGRHDACFLPRHCHITGDIDVHEMAYASAALADGGAPDPELWIVNTRFSCLCTLNQEHSFVPRWRPPFITSLGPEDRCHLNGLALVDRRPRYVTALGETDTPGGWREHKAGGGVLIDIDSGQVVCGELSMPHSPRWYDDQLWLLESGDGSLGTVDLATGRYEPLVHFNGFTRGLSFAGPFAFVGLSQIRESAVFSGIPIAERLKERICGVAVVHLPTREQVGFVQFQDAVQEIFAVEVLPHRFPEVLEPSDDRVANSYALPDEALRECVQIETEGP